MRLGVLVWCFAGSWCFTVGVALFSEGWCFALGFVGVFCWFGVWVMVVYFEDLPGNGLFVGLA